MQLFYPLGLTSDGIGVHKYHDTTKNQSYIPITGCVLSHILSCSELSSLEKMYYILADSLSCINSSKGRNRSISLPATSWSARLSCSKSEVFKLQHSLEDKGYFLIYRDKNDKGQNNRNTITSTVPDKVFIDLKYEPDRFGLCDINDECTDHNASTKLDPSDNIFVANLEGKRQHLEKTKMFIRVSYQFLKQLNSNCNISATAKVIILYLFMKIYKSLLSSKNNKLHARSYINTNCGSNDEYSDVCSHDHFLTHNPYSSVNNSIVISYQELSTELKLHRNSISKALKDLEDNNLISKKRFFIKDSEDYNSRANKSLWQISVFNVPLITKHHNQHEQTDRAERTDLQQPLINNQSQEAVISDQTKVEYNNITLESSKIRECTQYDPACTVSSLLYIKDSLLNNGIIKNIDYIDEKCLIFKDFEDPSANTSPCTLNGLPKTDISSVTCLSLSSASEENYKEEFFEDKQSLSSSEFYNNSSFLNDSFKNNTKDPTYPAVPKQNFLGKTQHLETPNLKQSCSSISSEYATRAIKDISEYKEECQELRHFYPLSAQDASDLNFRANREFSSNFVNQLLLKLYIKYPDKRFKNKFTFLSYMEQILANEKHQGPLVNHTSFRFSCNINEEDKNMQYYEKYLTEIENSFDISKEMQVRKKIAGRFSTEVAYKILTQVEFKTNPDNSFITALIPNRLDLREGQTEALRQQLEAVYGKNKYYVEIIEDAKDEDIQERLEVGEGISKKSPQEENKTKTEEQGVIQTFSKIPKGVPISAIPPSTAWHHIRKGLIEELGEAIDKAWFSKAVATEDNENSMLTLTMPTRFMSDWIRNNYSHVIQRLAGSAGVKRVEYVYST